MSIVERIEAHVASQIRISPCHTNRASQIGSSCERMLVYYRVAWEKQIPPTPRLQLIFNEGDLQEGAVLSLLQASGFEVYEQQAAHFDRKANLSAHLDAVLQDPKGEINAGKPFPVDVKSMAPNIWDIIESQASFQKRPWLKKYPAQIHVYAFFKGMERGCLICKNKSTGEIKEVWFDLDIDFVDEILKKCDRINSAVLKWDGTDEGMEKVLPDRIDDLDECKMCPFRLMCRPRIDFTAPLKIEDDPKAIELISKHESLSEAAGEYGSVHRKLTDMLKASAKAGGYDTYNALIGPWLVNGKADRAGKWSFVFTGAANNEGE